MGTKTTVKQAFVMSSTLEDLSAILASMACTHNIVPLEKDLLDQWWLPANDAHEDHSARELARRISQSRSI
eukprot:3694144-Amphidinium_carterae.2